MEVGIAAWVSRWAALQPEKPVIEFEGDTITWGDFDQRVTLFANALRDVGVRQGDRIGCLMHNKPEFLVTFFAAQRLGAVFVSLNVRLTARELEYIVGDAAPVAVVTEQAFEDVVAKVALQVKVDHWVSVDDPLSVGGTRMADLMATADSQRVEQPITFNDSAAILYTSGTTGLPKGAVITHGNLHFGTLNWLLDIGLGRTDRHLVVLPLCFTGGIISACMNVFHGGAMMVLERDFDPGRTLELIQRNEVTWMIAVPVMAKAMAEHPDFEASDLSSLRGILSGGAPVPVPLIETYQEKGVGFVQAFGITEGSGGINLYLSAEDGRRKVGSCGNGTLYGDVRLQDEQGVDPGPNVVGELLLGGPLVMQGYWNKPEQTSETIIDGWLHTGDLARRDEDGYYYIVDRKKDMVISGGLNVYPAEVEPVIEAFPEVAEAAVVGLPDDRWGEAVTAFVVLRKGEQLTGEELNARCRRELADYKVPKHVEFLSELPRTVSGKVMRNELREVHGERLEGARGQGNV